MTEAVTFDKDRDAAAVLARFHSALRDGVLETTAINIAAWAWRHPGENIVRARQEARHILRQRGKRLLTS